MDDGALRAAGWMTAGEMARKLGIGIQGVWRRAARGKLERKRSGPSHNWLYREKRDDG